VEVPPLVDKSQTDAVAQLARLGLKVHIREVPNSKPAGTITAQDPASGTKLQVGSTVTINVAKGPQPVAVPSVVSQPIDQASSQLQALGFKVATTFVDSDQPANTVIDQAPPAGQSAGKGSVISLTVSKGPKTSTIPDVTSTDVGSAVSTLEASGFKAKIVHQPVTDPNLDGSVLSQAPEGGNQAKPGTTVTLNVGQLAQGPPTTTTDTTTTP
jgi:serine/threonine-protein kinase